MKERKSGSKEGKGGDSPSQLIDARIKELSDWRGETLARIRILIREKRGKARLLFFSPRSQTPVWERLPCLPKQPFQPTSPACRACGEIVKVRCRKKWVCKRGR